MHIINYKSCKNKNICGEWKYATFQNMPKYDELKQIEPTKKKPKMIANDNNMPQRDTCIYCNKKYKRLGYLKKHEKDCKKKQNKVDNHMDEFSDSYDDNDDDLINDINNYNVPQTFPSRYYLPPLEKRYDSFSCIPQFF